MQSLYKIFFLSESKIVLLLFAFLLVAGYENGSAQNINPSAKKNSDFVTQDDKEFLKVKQFKVKTRYKYFAGIDNSGKPDGKKILITVEKFNRKGAITEMTEFNSAGTVISNYKFRYDSKNRPVKAEGTDDTGRSNVQTSKYDSRGYEIERGLISMGRKRNETKTVLNYDKEGNLTGLKNYLNDKLNDQQNFYYKNNLRTKTVILNGDGDTAIVMIPEYNEKGKLIREVKTEGKSSAAENYRYDDKGNLIELVDSETRREYRFDDKNNVIEHKMFLLDGRRQIRLIFNYNEKGLQSEQIRYDNSEKIVYHTVFEYEYYK